MHARRAGLEANVAVAAEASVRGGSPAPFRLKRDARDALRRTQIGAIAYGLPPAQRRHAVNLGSQFIGTLEEFSNLLDDLAISR